MKSTISWLDYNAAAREKTLQVLTLFREKDSRDELGISGIRDAIADQLFPGTSTIQTRLRYAFFIPWQYAQMENKGVSAENFQAEARQAELGLSAELSKTNELGVIGSAAGSTLRRLPSSIYWAGLGKWHIRRFPGTGQQYYAHANRLHDLRRHQKKRMETEEGDSSRTHDTWHPRVLQLMPKDFPRNADLTLTRAESGLLLDLWSSKVGDSLLAWLAQDMSRQHQLHDCNEIWAHPRAADFPEKLRHLLAHAQRFAILINGAALLYNLQLAELRPDFTHKIDSYQESLNVWAQNKVPLLHDWDLQAFWLCVMGHGHTITPNTQQFIRDFLALVLATHGNIVHHEPARQLIKQRERTLKKSRSRFDNPAVLKQWGGSSGVSPLNYRWHIAKDMLRDWFAGYTTGDDT